MHCERTEKYTTNVILPIATFEHNSGRCVYKIYPSIPLYLCLSFIHTQYLNLPLYLCFPFAHPVSQSSPIFMSLLFHYVFPPSFTPSIPIFHLIYVFTFPLCLSPSIPIFHICFPLMHTQCPNLPLHLFSLDAHPVSQSSTTSVFP